MLGFVNHIFVINFILITKDFLLALEIIFFTPSSFNKSDGHDKYAPHKNYDLVVSIDFKSRSFSEIPFRLEYKGDQMEL